jgi:hypothetical protein
MKVTGMAKRLKLILNDKEPFETDEEYSSHIINEGEYLELIYDGVVRMFKTKWRNGFPMCAKHRRYAVGMWVPTGEWDCPEGHSFKVRK